MRPLRFCTLILNSALWLFPVATLAQQYSEEDEFALVYGDKSTVSIATGSQQSLRRAPAVATVITAEDIKNMGATDLDQVLETVPGIHVARNPVTYSPLYVIRGIFSQFTPQTLVLQNRIPITTMFQGTKGGVWAGLPVENIARIEIIRGPGSALYGADAFAGVINIITKSAADTPGTEFGARVGSFNSRDAWIQHGGKLGPMDVAAYFRIGRTDGARSIVEADAQSQNDARFVSQASLAPGSVNLGHDAIDANLDIGYDKWRLRAGYKLRDNVGSGLGAAFALDPVGKAKSERITADLSWTDPQIRQDWGGGASISYLQYNDTAAEDFILFPAGARFPTGTFNEGMIGTPEKWERQWRLSAFATYTGFAGHRMRFGLGHDDLDLYKTRERKNFTFDADGWPVPIGSIADFSHTAPFMFPQRRKVNYVYAQDEWNFAKDWALTAGIRHDRYSDFGGTTNPRIALVWDASLDLTAKLLYGQAFRAPAFHEQHSINNPAIRGNPDLRPETIRTLEAAFSWQARRDVQANLSVFRYSMQDIIRAVPNNMTGAELIMRNTGGQTGKGMELELVWDATRALRLSGNYAYQRSIDEAYNQDAGYAPHHQVYARADWGFAPGWLLSSQVNWVADRKRAAGDTRPPVPDYTTLDLVLRTNRGKNAWDFSAAILNVFNADVREPSLAPGLKIPHDLPMAGRTFYLQARYSM